jgi:hypothetical protein
MKRFIMSAFLVLAMVFSAFSQTLTLDEAIKASTVEMGIRLGKEVKVAVLNFSSTSPTMAAYVIDELNNAIVNNGRLTAVDRQRLDLIRQELDFNDSGEVSNESAQQIGRMVGAQMIISGSLALAGSSYRFRVQALEVETAAIKYSYSQNIQNDQLVKTLMASGADAEIADFSTNERVKAAALNLFFGAGSFFVEKDMLGGGITAAAEALGVVGVIVGAGLASSSTTTSYGGGASSSSSGSDAAVPLIVGGAVLLTGGVVYGIIRAFTYHRPGSIVALNKAPFNLALVPGNGGNVAVQMSYILRY